MRSEAMSDDQVFRLLGRPPERGLLAERARTRHRPKYSEGRGNESPKEDDYDENDLRGNRRPCEIHWRTDRRLLGGRRVAATVTAHGWLVLRYGTPAPCAAGVERLTTVFVGELLSLGPKHRSVFSLRQPLR